MTNLSNVQEILKFRAPPVAVAFLSEAPQGVEAWDGAAMPAGCAFWREAQSGRSFYTVQSNHYECAVGAYTHAIDLPPERANELNETLGLMSENDYLDMAEVPGIPRLAETPSFVAYASIDAANFAPDVVILTLRPDQAMLVYEAALRAGIGAPTANLMGRPTCAVLPATVNSQMGAASLGCAGNRAYTGVGEDEFYVTVPGPRWQEFEEVLAQIVSANEKMGQHYAAHEQAIRRHSE